MWPGGRSAPERLDAMVSTLENSSLLYPQAENSYRSADETYVPSLAERVTSAFVDRWSPPGFQDHVQGKLKYARQ